MAKESPIGLAELIQRVKEELLEEHDETNPLFAIGSIELEISFSVERDAKGGISIQVVQAGVEKKWTDVQTVKVTLDPLVTIEEIKKTLTEEQIQQAKQTLKRDAHIDDEAEEQHVQKRPKRKPLDID
jgi:hypothetical protein